MSKRWRVAALCSMLALADALELCPSAAAQDKPAESAPKSAAEVLKQLGSSSKDYDQLAAALNSPDQSLRMAAFDAMVTSRNPALAELAIATARASADEAMRALAVRAAFIFVQTMYVNPQVQDSKDLASCKAYMSTVANIEYNYQAGTFRSTSDSLDHGSVSGNTINFSTDWCGGTLTAEEGTWTFSGPVRCNCDKGVSTGTFNLR